MRAKELHKRRFGAAVLPQAGPFAGAGVVLASSLSNFISSSGSSSMGTQNRAAPFKRNLYTISGTKIIVPNQGSCFGWFNICTIGAGTVVHANGGDGGQVSGGAPDGGIGGSGGSGGGGGGGYDTNFSTSGGSAGSGTDGIQGQSGDTGSGGSAGTGYANTRWASDGYIYPTGGNSDSLGGNGFGGAGNGLNFNFGTSVEGGPGGGGGGGLVVIVCNSLSGSGIIKSLGGQPGIDDETNISSGGGGGGILVCAVHYTGQITTDVSGWNGGASNGTASIYKINSDLSLTAKLWTDVW